MSLTFGAVNSDRVDIGSGTTIDDLGAGANGFSIAAWLYRTGNGGNQHVITKDQATATGGWSLLIDNAPIEGCVRFLHWRPGGTATDYITSGGEVSLNIWEFLAVTFKNGLAPDVDIYMGDLNTGAAEASYNTTTNGSGGLGTDADMSTYIGNLQRSTAFPFKGSIGVIAVFNKRLTLEEIQAWQFNPRMTADCVAFYELGNNGTGTQPDLSGNGNAGTVTGATQSDNPPLARSRRTILRGLYAVAAPAGPIGPLLGAGRLMNGGILTNGRLAA